MKVMQFKTLRKACSLQTVNIKNMHRNQYMANSHLLSNQTPEEEEILNKKRSKKVQKKFDERRKKSKISPLLEEQFLQGKLLGKSCYTGS